MNDMSICNPENQFDDCPGSGIKKIETVEEYLEEVDKVYKTFGKTNNRTIYLSTALSFGTGA